MARMQALQDDPENARAWALFHRAVNRFGRDAGLIGAVIQREMEGDDVETFNDMIVRLTLLYAVLTVVTAILGGIWSDRVAQRKVFVTVSGYVIAAALLSFILGFIPYIGGEEGKMESEPHKILGTLIHRKQHHFAQILLASKQHHDAINARGKSAVRRRTILERAIKPAEATFDIGV